MNKRRIHVALATIGGSIVLPALAALVAPFGFGLTESIDTARVATAAQQHPNFTVERQLAVRREINDQLHPYWKNLSVSARLARAAMIVRHALNGSGVASSSLASPANFVGNQTSISNPSGQAIALQRQANCSLTLYAATYTVGPNPTFQITGATPKFEQVLHQAAGLSTAVDVFAGGCAEATLGIGWRQAVYLGNTQGLNLGAGAGYDAAAGSNALYYGTADASTMAFHALSTDLSEPSIVGVAAGDLNGDGLADVVGLSGQSASISVWLAKPDGTIGAATAYALPGATTEAVVMADVNGDGKVDVVAASISAAGQEMISVLTGNGDGTLNPAQSSSVATPTNHTIKNMIAADLRGTGHNDLVASNGVVLLNSGGGALSAGSAAFTPELATTDLGPNLVAGDFNKDGKLDLAVDNGIGIHIFLGNGDGTFAAGRSYAAIGDVGYLSATDLDGDGNLDLYVGIGNGGLFSSDQTGARQSYALMGNGDGTFQGAPLLPFLFTGSNLGDLNGDHSVDAVGVNSDSSFTAYLGDGKGGFAGAGTLVSSPVTIGGNQYTIPSIDSYAIGDLNGDGKADLVYIAAGFNGPAGTPGVFLALGNGQGGFATPSFYAVPSTLAAGDIDINWTILNLHVADVNNDNKADLIYSYSDTSSNNNTVYFGTVVQLGNGDGTYRAPLVIPYRSAAYSSSFNPTETAYVQLIADLNHDGHPDLIFIAQSPTIDPTLSTYVSSIQVALGNGDGTFSTPTAVAGPNIMVQSFTDVVSASIAVADMNRDGIPDIVALGASSTYNTQLAVALGNGDGTFKAPALTNYTTQYLNNQQGIAVADVDGDGKVDVALTDPYTSVGNGISLGNGDGTVQTVNASSSTLPNLAINLAVSGAAYGADLNGDGKADLLAGNVLLLSQTAPIFGTAATTTALSASASSIAAGQSLTLTATVAAVSGATVPTGSVTFLDGAATLGTGTLSASGTATYTTSTLAVGSQSLTAAFGGSTTFAGSTSGAVTVTVMTGSPDFAAALNPTSGTVSPGQSAMTTVTLTPGNGFNQSVSLNCSGLPQGATCSFSSASVVLNGSAATSTLIISTAAATAMQLSTEPYTPLAPGGVLFASVGVPLVLRRRRGSARLLRSALLAALVLGAGALLQSCGGGSSSSGSTGTPAGTYTVTITATAGSTAHAAVYSLTVK